MRVGSGATVKVAPANWRSLASTAVRIRTTVGGRTTSRSVHGKPIGRRFATVTHAAPVRLAGGRDGVALKLRLRNPPKRGWIALAGTILRGGHAIERTLPLQISASAIRSGKALLQLPKALKKGRYTLRVRALETTAESGGVQGSETAERTLGLHLG